MKTTGVVRRIDDLGRIVIPKEIRKTLRIRDGESLEFFVDKETITLKKFSTSADLSNISQDLLDTIYRTIKKSIFVTDRDKFIAGSGELKKNFLGFNISNEIEEYLFANDSMLKSSGTIKELLDTNTTDNLNYNYIVSPILADGEALGLVLMIIDDARIFTEEDEHLVQIIASFLGKYLEE